MTTATLELSLPVALSMFSDLVGKKVTGTDCEPGELAGADATLRGVFVADAQAQGALYLIDLELAAALGAALVMMPAGLVRESVSDKALVPALVENCFEVLNVASRLVNRAGGVHYKLREQVLPGAALPEDAAGVLDGHTQRVDLELSVEGYGGGRLVILVA
jgi:hypothetical protein